MNYWLITFYGHFFLILLAFVITQKSEKKCGKVRFLLTFCVCVWTNDDDDGDNDVLFVCQNNRPPSLRRFHSFLELSMSLV